MRKLNHRLSLIYSIVSLSCVNAVSYFSNDDFNKSFNATQGHVNLATLTGITHHENDSTTQLNAVATIYCLDNINQERDGKIIGITSGHFFKKVQGYGLPFSAIKCTLNLSFDDNPANFSIVDYQIHPRYLELVNQVTELDPELINHDIAIFKVSGFPVCFFNVKFPDLILPKAPLDHDSLIKIFSYSKPFIINKLKFENNFYPQLNYCKLDLVGQNLRPLDQQFNQMIIRWNKITGLLSKDIIPGNSGINFSGGDSGSSAIDSITNIIYGIYAAIDYRDLLSNPAIMNIYLQYFKNDHRQVKPIDLEEFKALVNKLHAVSRLIKIQEINNGKELIIEFDRTYTVTYHFTPLYSNLDFVQNYINRIIGSDTLPASGSIINSEVAERFKASTIP